MLYNFRTTRRAITLLALALFLFSQNAQAAKPILIRPVPFTSQAPLGQWSDPRQKEGCEEASAAMAMAWVKGKTFTKSEWRNQIIAISDWEKKEHGEYRDVSLEDMVAWIFQGYYRYDKVKIKEIKTPADIISELEAGNIILAPMAGRLLKNPYYTPPGPLTHMLLIKGYDYQTKQFITNDAGTRRGESFRYSSSVLLGAIRPYPTGSHEAIKERGKKVIVVSRS